MSYEMIIRIQSPKIMVSLDCYSLVSGTQQEHESTTDRPTYDKECHAFEVHTKSHKSCVSCKQFRRHQGTIYYAYMTYASPVFFFSSYSFSFSRGKENQRRGIEHKTLWRKPKSCANHPSLSFSQQQMYINPQLMIPKR